MPVDLPLRTERLTLRAYRAEDRDWLFGVYSREDVAQYLPDEPWTAEVADEKIAKRVTRTDLDGESGSLSLVIEHEGAPVGDLSLWLTDPERRVAEMGWTLDPAHQGHGYAREAAAAVLRLAFEHYRVHRVVAQMDARNPASARVAEAAGMRREAHHLQDYWMKGEWTDTFVYAALAQDVR